MTKAPLPKSPDSMEQEQFLTILSREDALARGHDFPGGHVVEFDCAVDERFLEGWEHAHSAGGGGDEF